MIRILIVGGLVLAATALSTAAPGQLTTFIGEPEGGEFTAPITGPFVAGLIVAIDHGAGRITLAFKPIPHLFLEGGTRTFRVEDRASLTSLGPGDKVRFEIRRDGAHDYVVTRIAHSN